MRPSPADKRKGFTGVPSLRSSTVTVGRPGPAIPSGEPCKTRRRHADIKTAQIGDERRPSAIVVDDYDPAIAAIIPGKGHSSSRRRHDLGAGDWRERDAHGARAITGIGTSRIAETGHDAAA